MSIVKNQHYVPQRHLRYFALPRKKKKGSTYVCNVLDKEKCEVRKNQNIEQLASEKFYHDVDFEKIIASVDENTMIDEEILELTKNVDKQTLEKLFANKVETTMFDAIDRIISNYTMTVKSAYPTCDAIKEEDRAMIAYYLSLQFIRSREFREFVIQMHEKAPMHLMEKDKNSGVDPDFFDNYELKLKPEHINLFHNQYMMDTELIESFSMNLLNHFWFVAVNETEEEFWISDNPVAIHGHQGKRGLASPGVEIVFPITSKIALVIREASHFERDAVLENRFIEIPIDLVHFYNSMQVVSAYRNIYSKKSSFEKAIKELEDNPELKNKKRDRFIMG